jgi:hypothetical protein
METELVVRAQKGDEGAFASLAVAAGDRLRSSKPSTSAFRNSIR